MLSSMDTPSQLVESPWQDCSLHAFHPLDPSSVENQTQQHQDYNTNPIPTSSFLLTNEKTYVENNGGGDHTLPHFTASHLAPLVDLHMHFQDLPTFIRHPDFDHFAYCWMESQYHIGLSKHAEYRPTAMTWFASMSMQLALIASGYTSFVPNEDAEASTPRIKAAYQRLVHYFNVMHKVIDTIERGRASCRSPQEIMLPIFNQLLAKAFGQQLPSISIPSQPTSHHSLTYEPLVPNVSMSMPPSLNHSDASTPQGQIIALEFPPDHLHLLPHDSLSLSDPITPNGIDGLSSLFWSYPTITDQHQHTPEQLSKISSFGSLSPSPMETIQSEESESTLMHLDAYHRSPRHVLEDTLSEDQGSEYQQSSMDEDDEDDEDDGDDGDDDDGHHDYKEEDGVMDSLPTRERKTKKSTTIATRSNNAREHADHQGHSTEFGHKTPAATHHHFPRRGRTATSYDDDTTHFLKTVFFNIYSQRDKLTKDQRRQVVERTGLKPRNVTYWFSNHKRRFQAALEVFKRLVAESNGRIQTYDDFIQWRRENGLPEDITDNRS